MKELQEEFENNGEKQRQKFLKHFYEILDNPKNDQIIRWHKHGFVIWNVDEFKKQLLPSNFKHNNYQSLMRQLNKYGFKIKSKENQQAYFTYPTIRKNNREQQRNNQSFINQKEFIKNRLPKRIKSLKSIIRQSQRRIKDLKQIVLTFNKNYDEITIPLCQIEYDDFAYCWICKYIWKSLIYKSQENMGQYWRRSFSGIKVTSKYKLQLNSIVQGFPELLETRMPTPFMSNLGTPLPFYQFIGQMKEFTSLLLQ